MPDFVGDDALSFVFAKTEVQRGGKEVNLPELKALKESSVLCYWEFKVTIWSRKSLKEAGKEASFRG